MKKYFAALLVILMSATLVYAHGDATHLTGTVTAIEGDHIQIKDQAGKLVMVMLSKTTKYLKTDKAATKAELKAGTRVVIDAKMDEKMKMYAASEVRIGVMTTATPGKVATPKAK